MKNILFFLGLDPPCKMDLEFLGCIDLMLV